MKLLRPFVIAVSVLLSSPAFAADPVPWAEGTIRKIAGDKATIAHGPIDSIGMAPMTMQFTVKDAAGLAKLKPGDKVRFQAVIAGGEVVVTRIEVKK